MNRSLSALRARVTLPTRRDVAAHSRRNDVPPADRDLTTLNTGVVSKRAMAMHAAASSALPALVFALIFFQASWVAIHEKAISPFDEGAHFDYVVQLERGRFPIPAGQRYSDLAIQEWACRPTDLAASISSLCGVSNAQDDPRVPFAGVNYEAPFGPLYYLPVAAFAGLMGAVGIDSLNAARLASAFVYAIGALALYFLALRLGARKSAGAGLILAISSSRLALGIGGTVNPDAAAFVLTASVVSAAALVTGVRRAILWTTVMSLAAGLTKPNFVVAAILGSVILGLRMIREDPSVPRSVRHVAWQSVAITGLPVAVSAAASAGWAALAGLLNHTGTPADGGIHLVIQSNAGFLERVAQELWALIRPDGGTAPGPAFSELNSTFLRATSLSLAVVFLGAAIVAWTKRGRLAGGGLLILRAIVPALVLSAVSLVAIYWAAYQGGKWTASRYALPFLAAAAVGVAASLPHRAALAAAGVGVLTWAAAWVALLG